MMVTQLLSRMEAQRDRQEAERRVLLETWWQQHAVLAEMAALLKATRLRIEAQLRQRRQEPLWGADCHGSAGVDLIHAFPTLAPMAPGERLMSDRLFDATPDYDTDFYAWTQAQAAAIRARDWAAVDVEHVAEEIEDLCKSAGHHLAMLVLGFLELIYRPCPADEGRCYWQSAVIGFERSMLERILGDSPRLRPVLEGRLPEEYAWAREQVMRRRTPPRQEPPERCPWSLDHLLDERWWPPEAPPRLP
jgi:Domain of unknown function DUF29